GFGDAAVDWQDPGDLGVPGDRDHSVPADQSVVASDLTSTRDLREVLDLREVEDAPPFSMGCYAEIHAGFDHTCARRVDGTVWCWGSNGYGEYGDGTNMGRFIPTRSTFKDAVSLETGGRSTCAINMAGEVWCWGYNERGQLGDGTNTNR